MANGSIPFVAVVGGFYDLDAARAAEAKAAAQSIGAALAAEGFGLVVYFSDDGSLEPHVVAGYVAALPNGGRPGSIRVRYAESQRGQVRFSEEASRKELFEHRIFPSRDWEAPFYRSLVDASGVDAVVLVAGGRSTLIAGQVAVARKLPILAVDRFGGSAGVIWTELARGSDDYPSSSTHDAAASATWLKNRCALHAARHEEATRREMIYQRVTSQSRRTVWAAVAFVALLVTLFFGVAQPPVPSSYSFLMFAALIASGATGALVRAVIWGAEDTAPTTSLLLGGVAGFVVGLAYLIPQFVGAPGVLEVNAEAVGSNDKIQFVSAVLVAISAGVGFDTVFTRLRKQAEEVEIKPPGVN